MGNKVKNVSKAEFEKQDKASYMPRRCPMCNTGEGLIVDLPMPMKTSITIKCKHCNHSVTEDIRFEYFSGGEDLGSFITTESFTKSLFEVVKKWNAGHEVTANA